MGTKTEEGTAPIIASVNCETSRGPVCHSGLRRLFFFFFCVCVLKKSATLEAERWNTCVWCAQLVIANWSALKQVSESLASLVTLQCLPALRSLRPGWLLPQWKVAAHKTLPQVPLDKASNLTIMPRHVKQYLCAYMFRSGEAFKDAHVEEDATFLRRPPHTWHKPQWILNRTVWSPVRGGLLFAKQGNLICISPFNSKAIPRP